MSTTLPPIWNVVLASALVGAIVSWLLSLVTELVRHKRAKVEHFEKLMLDRKFEAINRVWQATTKVTEGIAPYRNGARAFEVADNGQWLAYQEAMRIDFIALYSAFNENALILGAPIWRVWTRYRQYLDYFFIMGRHSGVPLPHLIRFCSEFPVELKEAIANSLHDPTISVLTREEETCIRRETSAILKDNQE